VHPSVIVLLDSLNQDVLKVAFHALPPKGTLKSRHPILPCSDDTLPTVHLPPPGEEQLDSHRRHCRHT
jgi:hypothetical protein